MPLAPRIYNLHPLLAGPIESWAEHLPRIKKMGFDWIYVNSFAAPGGSGSIYAVDDPFELHPLVRAGATGTAKDLTQSFVASAARHDLKVMTDLILPHAARDGRLVRERPDWVRWHPGGSPMSPMLANPNDTQRPRYMEDLAELDLANPGKRDGQLDWFRRVAEHHLDAGMSGFRCSAAYKVPPELWRALLPQLRAQRPDTVFVAAALGCPFEQVRGLAGCGFDLIFDSSRWWDFHDSWFLDQYEVIRHFAPTISFPEDHNTRRLAVDAGLEDPEAVARLYRARYLACIGLGCGVMMPMGFEYGVREALDPVHSRPEHWLAETRSPRIDLTEFIAAANRLKADTPVLQRPGPQRRVTAPNARIAGVLRLDAGSPMAACATSILLVNPDQARSGGLETGSLLTAAGGRVPAFEDATPLARRLTLGADERLTLDPLGVRLFVGHAVDAVTAVSPQACGSSEQRLIELAKNRVAIEKVSPELDGGRFAVKRIVGDVLRVEADIFSDGHEKLAACIKYRAHDEALWHEAPMAFVDNDRWAGRMPLTRNTRYVYTVEAWRDLFASWRLELGKKHDAGQNITLELGEGLELVRHTAKEAEGSDREPLDRLVAELEAQQHDEGLLIAHLLAEDVRLLMARASVRTDLSRYGRELEVVVDRTAAAFAAWYELFPRSQSDDPQRHGSFDDVIRKLPYVRDMGFDVLYFPPIHPIGSTNRKGRNNSTKAQPGDPGSPYAIGSVDGGHDGLHPELGTFDDFKRLVAAAHDHGLEIAIDFAINCSPDHPWIKQHPGWFDWRADGTIKYAENPPKKYEDIVNVSFYREDALPALWIALRDVILFWIEHGVKTFRVDNPHTKPLPFWEWMIREVQDRHPEAVFLSEAFTKPKMMRRLAKLGFTQSYSYFTWRNTKPELTEYLTELTRDEPREHMRSNFFVNTPDINPVYLQSGGRAGFQVRAVLASTLSTLWGVYSGFELCEGTPLPGKEEYLNSEKFEIKAWDWNRPGNIRDFITRLNHIRRENPALWQFADLEFQNAWDPNILVYCKMSSSADNAVLVAVNLDPTAAHGCNFELPLWRFGLGDDATIGVDDLLTGTRFACSGKVQHIWLDPAYNPCAIWRLIPPGLPA